MPILYALSFSLALLVSAALLFLVQPLVGKTLLPYWGGAPVAWNLCLVFFQALLLAGYLYAHLSNWLLGARRQALLHVLVLCLPAGWLLLGMANVLPNNRLTIDYLDFTANGVPSIVALSDPPPGQKRYFHFLHDARERCAKIGVFTGDGRLQMARQGPANYYHAIFIEAFNSDAIPTHLITKEALQMYLEKLAPGGVICIHISNRHVDLEPIIANTARSLNLVARTGNDRTQWQDPAYFISTWIVLTRDRADLLHLCEPEGIQEMNAQANQPWLRIQDNVSYWRTPVPDNGVIWTDDYTDLVAALRDRPRGGVIRLMEMVLTGLALVLLMWFLLEVVSRSVWKPEK